jgi:hypothetical protein
MEVICTMSVQKNTAKLPGTKKEKEETAYL